MLSATVTVVFIFYLNKLECEFNLTSSNILNSFVSVFP